MFHTLLTETQHYDTPNSEPTIPLPVTDYAGTNNRPVGIEMQKFKDIFQKYYIINKRIDSEQFSNVLLEHETNFFVFKPGPDIAMIPELESVEILGERHSGEEWCWHEAEDARAACHTINNARLGQ